MDFQAMCKWVREQAFPSTEGQLRQKLLESAELQPVAFEERDMQTRFLVLDDVLRFLAAKGEFRRTGDLSLPALTTVERL
jgi:hypothetical protein